MFNLMKTAVLMAAITALFMLLGRMLGGPSGMMLALVVALGMNFFSYWNSDKIVLRMYGARDFEFVSISADKPAAREKALKFLQSKHSNVKNYIFSGNIYKLIFAGFLTRHQLVIN